MKISSALGVISLLAVSTSTLVFAGIAINKKEIYTANAPAPIGIYSQAIRSRNTIYISGQIPLDPKTGEIAHGDFTAQVEQTVKNLSAITKAAGGNLSNIVKLTVYLTDLNNFSIVNDVMKKYFNKPYPARAVIEIKALPKQASVEIEAVMQID